ncbi:uncharacterized protein METZ01_LOCUS502230, partial [marine metagenome]
VSLFPKCQLHSAGGRLPDGRAAGKVEAPAWPITLPLGQTVSIFAAKQSIASWLRNIEL